MDLLQKVADKVKEREQQNEEALKLMEERPRCAILSSPEKLDESIGSPGSDETDTLRDFDLIKEWATKSKLLNVGFYNRGGTDGNNLQDGVYDSFISNSFKLAFDAMRYTKSPELEELVIWYYAGHGLSKKAAQNLSYSSTPNLTRADVRSDYYAAANEFVKEGRKVQGGELCLHKVGFCDLYGLLKPWIAAVKAGPINAKGNKKNKHLVIILDSCYSGIIAQELKDFNVKMNTKDESFLQENSVTIQASCGPDQVALGGFFTPCFVYLNNPENTELLNNLKADWMGMSGEERNEYRSIKLPSPMVVTTRPQSQDDVTLELTLQNFKLTLFQDPGFFKFCSIKVYQHQDNSWFNSKERVLNHTLANDFMTSCSFTVLDYKLKKMVTGPYAGSPMGLFLLDGPKNSGYAVCAHIHFQKGNTNNPQRINLVHHKEPPFGSVRYTEDHDGLSQGQVKRNAHKIQVPLDANGLKLVQACRDYVTRRECFRWSCISRWNMTTGQCGVNGSFRVQERLQERSAWEDSYLQHIKVQNIAKADDADIANNNNNCCCCWLF